MGIGEETSKPIWGSVSHASSTYALNGKIMFSSAIILFFAIFMILCFHSYARWSFRRQERRIRRRIRAHLRCLSASSQDQPLDTAVLQKIPIFVYSSTKTPLDKEECAICLSDFEEDDEARLLPKCGHTFHVDCIDTWFRSRSTCPLCRAPVQPVNDIETDSSSSSSTSSSTSVQFPMEACEREPIDLVGIIVDTPTELQDSNPGQPIQTESKFSGIRVLFSKTISQSS